MPRPVLAVLSPFVVLLTVAVSATAQTKTPPARAVSSAPAVPPLSTKGAIDPAAMAILKKSQDKMLSLRTFRAECWETQTTAGKPDDHYLATLTAKKPNLMRYEYWLMTAPDATRYQQWERTRAMPSSLSVCDGRAIWNQDGRRYRKDYHTAPNLLRTQFEPWDGFYTTSSWPLNVIIEEKKRGRLLGMVLARGEIVEGVACDVVCYHHKIILDGRAYLTDTHLSINKDGIVQRKRDTVHSGAKPGYKSDYVIRHIVTDAPIPNPATAFKYTPAQGVIDDAGAEASGPKLLANGTVAPSFSVTDAANHAVRLSDFKGKVVVIDFWSSWCGPCVASMPHNQSVIKKLQDEGIPVMLLAVDASEIREAFALWVARHRKLTALRFVFADPKSSNIFGVYHISGIPAQYVVDADGIIRASSVGYGGETGELEMQIRAVAARLAHRSHR